MLFRSLIGEIGDSEKSEFLGNAHALLFPINWQEPFGLAMIEALGCGTPVIAYPKGSVPEILEDGRTGFLVNSVAEAAKAVEDRVHSLDRRICRQVFEDRFSVERMCADYVDIFEFLRSRAAKSVVRVRTA